MKRISESVLVKHCKMYFQIILICVISSPFIEAFTSPFATQDNNDNVASIDEQVAPLGSDVFCLFTYGNWVMARSMQQDVPSAVNAGVARLPYHRLDFSYFSQDLGGSFPTLVPDCGYEVWGELYLIPVQDLDTVLLKGGIVDNKKVFHFVQKVVETYSNGNIINVKCNAFQQQNLPEKLIYGLPLPQDRRPSQQILDMLTEAYTDAGLPQRYIEEISQLPTIEQGYLQTNLVPTSQSQQKPTIVNTDSSVVIAPDSVVVAPDSVVVNQQNPNPQVTTQYHGVPPMNQVATGPNNQVVPANNIN